MNKTTEENIQFAVETIHTAFLTRDFAPMVALFADEAIYEVPFALDESHTKDVGIDAIRKRFDRVSESGWNKAVKIEKVILEKTKLEDDDAVLVRFFIEGIRKSDGQKFDFPSSIAIIRFQDSKILHYQDYPNLLGITKAAGLLAQFAATLEK